MGARVVAVRASYNYSMALTAGGQVLTWGYNGSGQLGTGFHTASEVPVRVRLPRHTRVAAIATGGYDGLVLTRTGRVLAWGDNKYGQLGNGTYRSSELPVAVKVPPGVRILALGGGSQHSLALTSAARLLAWGYNAFGQLGTGVTHGSNVPVRVRLPAAVRITQVSAGGGFSVALTSAGRVLAWGHNELGQLGDGGTASSRRPVSVRLPAGLTAAGISHGLFGVPSRNQTTVRPARLPCPQSSARLSTSCRPFPASPPGSLPTLGGPASDPSSATEISRLAFLIATISSTVPPGSPDMLCTTAFVTNSDVSSRAASACACPSPISRATKSLASRTCSGRPGIVSLPNTTQ